MTRADAHAKPLCSSQPVGLLAVLADSASPLLSTFGQQKLFRHVSYPQSYHPYLCLSHTFLESENHLETESPQTPLPEEKLQQRSMKKVRFAPDVVEPRGDSRAYRGRKDADKVTHKKACDEMQGNIEMEKTVERDDAPTVTLSYHHHNCRKPVKPPLPANRMLLYKGMQCYKSKIMPCL